MRADSRWPLVQVVVAAAGLLLAVVPFYVHVSVVVAVMAIAVGAGGLGLGVRGLVRSPGFSVTALTGITAGGLAVLLAVVAILVDVTVPAVAPANDRHVDTPQVLDDELEVNFGAFRYRTGVGATGRTWVWESGLPITVRNKLDATRTFELTVAGFESEHRQVADASDRFTLKPGATQTIDFFAYGLSPRVAEKLKSADLRVIVAHSADTDPAATQYLGAGTETVLADQLEVKFGEPGPYSINGINVGIEVPLTLVNRLDEARTYSVEIVAMDGNVQLATGLVTEVLAPHAIGRASVTLDKMANPNATYEVLVANSYPVAEGSGT
ncbi:hypothetical protein [Mycolicibacterium sp. HK-90]|uniref:hypothetical protein n=1 Tax=Mycolicibacterium sp. HK-90 TaxID=3056937 RepID=UPI002657F124|nr:hypothetical protein [Mycolicibacterium sp. HK-90]WKG05564.1 hypothetical protein QU592_11000 [Mycolicibacterium sp. HK-90]